MTVIIEDVEYTAPNWDNVVFQFGPDLASLTITGLVPNSDVAIYDVNNNKLAAKELTSSEVTLEYLEPEEDFPAKVTVYLNLLGYVVKDVVLTSEPQTINVDQVQDASCKCGDSNEN